MASGAVRVHHDQALGTGGRQRVRDHPGTDGLTGPAPAVLPGIPKIRQDSGNSPCPAPAAGIEQQQLHDVADRGPRGLDHIHVVTAQVTHDRAQLIVRKPVQLARHRLAAQRLHDRTGQQRVGGP